MFRCPGCEAGGAAVIRGEEFEVESIVVEEDGPAAHPKSYAHSPEEV